MKPPPFAYHAPTETEEAVALLATLGEQARPLAGGQSLVPLLNLRLARPAAIVDLNRIDALAYHRVNGEALVVGALCRHRDIELDSTTLARCAAIAEAVPLIGHVGIRNRGTVVGSLAHADPAAEWPALALLLDASIEVRGPAGTREVPARDFFRGAFVTAAGPGELVVQARFPLPPPDAGSAFLEVAPRHGDFALGAAAAVVDLAADGTVREARVALAGVGATASRATAAEAAMAGRAPDRERCADAASAAADTLDPADDIHASAAYRRRLGATLIRRVLLLAASRARREELR